MSRIIEKAFDASKKIIRSIFKGSPNLITSADLNRQMEAFKYQLDQLDDKTGFISDIEVTHSLSAGTLGVNYTFSYLRFKGCSFSPVVTSLSINLTNSAPTAYLCLVAEQETITYNNDSTHEIAGAKFIDGTSMPAANQLRYINERLVLTHALSSLNNLVGVVALFVLSETSNVIVKMNTISERDSLSMGKSGVILDFNPSLIGKVGNGKSYDEAFSILENRFANFSPEWDYLTYMDYSTSASGVEKDTEIAFRVQNGIMYLNMPEQKLNKVVTRLGSSLLVLGEFPSDKRANIISFLKRMNLASFNKFSASERFIPYGEFGCFPLFRPYVAASKYPIFGFAKVSLLLFYDSDGVVTDACIGMYVTGALQFGETTKDLTFEGPVVDWLSLPDSYVYVPRLIGAIPLFGPI